MFFLLFLIILQHLDPIQSCDPFQTRRTCECKAVYSQSLDPANVKTLFTVANYDDCGINLGCEKTDCAENCKKRVLDVLGGRQDYITLAGKNKVCALVTPASLTITLANSIHVWAVWKYSTCREGAEPVVQDVCCNRKCKCQLTSQKVASISSPANLKTLTDLTADIVAPIDASYECATDLVSQCQDECLNVVGNFFNNKEIKKPDPKRLNLNVFMGDEYASNKVCLLLNEGITKPGVDIYAQIDTGISGGADKFVSLGRMCCRRDCKCEYVFRDAFTNEEAHANVNIPTLDPYPSLGYECADELSDCLAFCRRSAFSLMSLTNSTFRPVDTLTETDIFRNNNIYKKYICNLLEVTQPSDGVGYNVYMRYSTYKGLPNADLFPYREDLHLGRLCCQKLLGSVIGINRCDKTTPDPTLLN